MADGGGPGRGRSTGPQPGAPGAAEVEARRALDAYPRLGSMGVVFTCVEKVGKRWRIRATGMESPQQARDHLAHLFLVAVSETGDAGERAAYQAAADMLEYERHDEMTVQGRRFRIGRIERSIRTGPDGPEPPRDSDPAGVPGEDSHRTGPRRSEGFINEVALTGTAAAIMRYEMRNKVPEGDSGEVEDGRRALETHPQIVFLPAEFVAAEEVNGRWRPRFGDTEATVQAARDRLARYLRPPRIPRFPPGHGDDELFEQVKAQLTANRPDARVCALWEKAADRLDRERLTDLRTAGYHFRIIRVDQIVRLGPDGPEPPRPSDPDPYGPPGID